MKKIFGLASVALVCAGALVLLEWPSSSVDLLLCDVGQGDAILITSGFTQILVDGGQNDAVLECIGEHIPYWDRHIELVIATHADADHIGGLVSVLKNYHVREIWDNGQFSAKDTAVAADFAALVASQVSVGSRSIAATSGDGFAAADKKIIAQVLAPSRGGQSVTESTIGDSETTLSDKTMEKAEGIGDTNNGSIVLLLELSKVLVLLTGDIELEGELALLSSGLIPDVHILKVAHHGAKTSSSHDFLEKSRPEIALIGVGEKNKFGHPAPEVIDRLKQLNAVIVRTDQDGTVKFRLENGEIASSVLEEPLK